MELKFSHIVISYDVPLIPLDYILFKDDFLYSVSKDLKLYRGEKQSLTQLEHLDLLTFAPIYIAKEFGEKLLKEKNQDLFSYNEIKDYIVNGNTEGLKSLICKEGQEYLPTLFFDYTI